MSFSDTFSKNNCVVFLAGGSGTRMRGVVDDKIFAPLAGKPVLAHAVLAFAESALFRTAVFVCRDAAQEQAVASVLETLPSEKRFGEILFCRGGKERRDSVLNGLETAAKRVAPEAFVWIHDAARPLVKASVLREVSAVACREGAAVLAHRCVNTVKRVPAGILPGVACEQEDLERERLWEMETPQVFPLEKILRAYTCVTAENRATTDDVSAFVGVLGEKVALVENPDPNLKITSPLDLRIAEVLKADF